MAPIGIALVGCGQIAGVHLRAIAALQGQATLVRTVDADADRAAKAATAHGASHWGTDLDEALADERVDAAVMCLPHDLHRDFAVKAAQAGKHVLMEKPMALDEAEAKAMVEAAEANGTQLSIGQSTRCMDSYWQAKKCLARGDIGAVVNVVHQRLFYTDRLSTPWRRTAAGCGGLYLPLFGSHDVDALLWLLDDTPQRVWGAVRTATELSDGDSDGLIGLEFADGKIASIAFSMQSRQRREEMLLVGAKGSLAIRRNQLTLNGEDLEIEEREDAFLRQLRRFVLALQAGQPVPVSGREVLKVMRVLDLVKQASATGQAQDF